MKVVTTLFCFLFLYFSLCAQNQDDLTAIRNVMHAQIKAWNNGDIDGFMHTYWKSDSLMFIGSTKPTYGWQATLDHYKKSYPDTSAMGKLSFNLIQLKPLSEDYYYVIGEWHLKRNTAKDLGGYFTLLFRKIIGEWKIVVDHTS